MWAEARNAHRGLRASRMYAAETVERESEQRAALGAAHVGLSVELVVVKVELHDQKWATYWEGQQAENAEHRQFECADCAGMVPGIS